MAGKRRKPALKKNNPKEEQINAHIRGAGEIVVQPIAETLEVNYMPYAMSVILSRAIPEIDGFKPSHRKILYTMFKMGLLKGARSKSANIVGRTMQLNPHGDAAIYETMVRLSRGYEALLHPFVDSKGNFGKAYSRDMMWAASRYTEAKLEAIGAELFRDIDRDTVDFADNYDNTMKEPVLLPVSFPTVLVNANTGIAVGMASSISSFNLEEVCNTTIKMIDNPKHKISDTLLAPDFSSGGNLIYDHEDIEKIYETGRGSIKIRATYSYDKKNNCIDILEIPPTTTAEAIIDKVVERVKSGEVREINDIRDETDKSGLKITIDLKRAVGAEKLMQKLYRMTPLEDSFSCNFNVLVNGYPRVLGVAELLIEWINFRTNCVRRRINFDLKRAKERLHLLKGLEKILLDIDKAIKIIRNTQEEAEVVPNLMIGFMIDEIQAEFVAEIKLRHLNKEHILKRTQDIKRLQDDIEEMENILASARKIKKIIKHELKLVIDKYGKERQTKILYDVEEFEEAEEEIEDYPIHLFFTKEGYFKKVTPQSLRMSGEHKFKEGDSLLIAAESSNNRELLFFSDQSQVYKSRASDFEETRISLLGDYVPASLEMDEGEEAVYMAITKDYSGYMLFFFENGKIAKIEMEAYKTKTNRKKLLKAYSSRSKLTAALQIEEDCDLVVISTAGRYLLFNTGAITPKATRDSVGVSLMKLKKGHKLKEVRPYKPGEFARPYRYKTKNLPSAGALLSPQDKGEQLKLD
ncbi:MAG: topoisomerase IV [Clostridiales bacterium]|nr:topoisomerase IV [Clostridiales bacterium]